MVWMAEYTEGQPGASSPQSLLSLQCRTESETQRIHSKLESQVLKGQIEAECIHRRDFMAPVVRTVEDSHG